MTGDDGYPGYLWPTVGVFTGVAVLGVGALVTFIVYKALTGECPYNIYLYIYTTTYTCINIPVHVRVWSILSCGYIYMYFYF